MSIPNITAFHVEDINTKLQIYSGEVASENTPLLWRAAPQNACYT